MAVQTIKAMLKRRIRVDGAHVLILGLTFKKNCSDPRNTRIVDVVAELRDYGVHVDVRDPCSEPREARDMYGVELVTTPKTGYYDGVILALANEFCRHQGAEALRRFGCDLKRVVAAQGSDFCL